MEQYWNELVGEDMRIVAGEGQNEVGKVERPNLGSLDVY
jgi:hypothetical protein